MAVWTARHEADMVHRESSSPGMAIGASVTHLLLLAERAGHTVDDVVLTITVQPSAGRPVLQLEVVASEPDPVVCGEQHDVYDGPGLGRPNRVRCSRPSGHEEEHGVIRAHVLHTWPRTTPDGATIVS